MYVSHETGRNDMLQEYQMVRPNVPKQAVASQLPKLFPALQ